jgi:hypothetical protein
MEKLGETMRVSGLSSPADTSRELPTVRTPCAAGARAAFRACAHRDELGAVHGDAWEAMADDGYVLATPMPFPLVEPRERTR